MFTHNPVILTELPSKNMRGYRWYNTPENNWYPSITTVLGIKPKPFLDVWRANLGTEAAKKETERCAIRGTAVHDMCEKYINNVEKPTDGHVTEHIKLFNMVKIALNRINNVLAQEVPLYSDVLMVAGRVDCIAEYNGVPSIIDFKTSTNIKSEDMILDYYLQETFYALAFYECTGIEIKQIVTIMTVEKGLLPQVWVKPIIPYIIPLQRRITEFYEHNH